MDLLTELGQDMVDLWLNYWPRYLIGIRNTVILAIVATALGCLIGFICGILNTIPYSKQDHVVKRFFVKLIRVIVRIYVEVFRGTPMVLQAVFIFYGLPYFTTRPWPSPAMPASGLRVSSLSPSTPAPIWPRRCGAASSPLTPARPRAPWPSA